MNKSTTFFVVIAIGLLLSGCTTGKIVGPDGTITTTGGNGLGTQTTTVTTPDGTVTTTVNSNGFSKDAIKSCVPGKKMDWSFSGTGSSGPSSGKGELTILGQTPTGCHAQYTFSINSTQGNGGTVTYDMYFDGKGEVSSFQINTVPR